MLLIGLIFSGFEARDRARSMLASRWFWHGFAFASLFNVAVVYAAIKQPDWMWMYFTESGRLTAFELAYVLVFLYYAPFVGGFVLGLEARQASNLLWILALLVAGVVNVAIIWHLFDRYAVVGTRLEFYEGIAPSLFSAQNPIGTVMNVCFGLMAAHFAWVVLAYRRQKRRRGRQSSIVV